MIKQSLKFSLVIIGLAMLISCVSTQPKGVKKSVVYPQKVDAQMEKAYQVGNRYYQRGHYRAAIEVFTKYINAYKYNRYTDEAYYKIGKIHFIDSKWDLVLEKTKPLLSQSPNPSYRSKSAMLIAHAMYKKGDYDIAQSYLNKIKPFSISSKLQLRYYSLAILVGQKRAIGKHRLAYAFMRLSDLYHGGSNPGLSRVRAVDVISEPQTRDFIDTWIHTPMSVSEIPSWFKDYPRGFSRPIVEYKWAKVYYEEGKKDQAKKLLSRYIKSYPKHRYVSQARKMLSKLGGAVKVSAKGDGVLRIGVILPLSGPRSSFGKSILEGIKCAAGKVQACKKDSLGNLGDDAYEIELVVHDSLNSANHVLGLVGQLVSEDVSAIIGPMSAALTNVAAQKAQSSRVPLLPITQKPGVMAFGDYVFQMGYDAASQVKEVVKQARRQGAKSFGIFHPTSNYGREYANLITNEVERQGGKIAAQVAYDPSQSLSTQARQLKLNVNRFSYSDKASGFDALFIPDSYWMVMRLAPALQFVNIKGIPLIGTNSWNDEKLAYGVFNDFPNSFFTDVFYAKSSDTMSAAFVSSYKQAYGATPKNISALGFDAVNFIHQAARRTGSTKPYQIKDALNSIGSFNGVTGIKSFSKGIGPNVRPYILRPAKEGIKQD